MRDHLKWEFLDDDLKFSDPYIDKILKSIKVSRKKASPYGVDINDP